MECLRAIVRKYFEVSAKGSCAWVAGEVARDLQLDPRVVKVGTMGVYVRRPDGSDVMFADLTPAPRVPVHGRFAVYNSVVPGVLKETVVFEEGIDMYLHATPHTVTYVVFADQPESQILLDGNVGQFAESLDVFVRVTA